MTGSVSGTGTAGMSITFNTPILGAIAETTGTASFVITGALVPYAIGHMTGTTDVTTELTADQVAAATVAALAATTIPVDVRKVNAISVDGSGTSGDPWGLSDERLGAGMVQLLGRCVGSSDRQPARSRAPGKPHRAQRDAGLAHRLNVHGNAPAAVTHRHGRADPERHLHIRCAGQRREPRHRRRQPHHHGRDPAIHH